jgi:predicted ATPase
VAVKLVQRFYIKKIHMKPYSGSSYLAELPVVQYLNKVRELDLGHEVTFFVGENGTGKSTLIEAIATCAGFNAEGGSKNFLFATKNTVSHLSEYLSLTKSAHEKDGFFLRAESFYNVASQVDDLHLNLSGYGGISLHEQSHGESFMALIQHRFRGNGLYILDEPESALSPLRQMTLLVEMKRLVEQHSQLIIATHSPILLAYPQATIYQLTEHGIEQVAYEQTEHYIVTK